MEIILSAVILLLISPAAEVRAQIVGPSSSVSDFSSADTRYVNVAGDTMTGALAITANSFSVGTSTFVVAGGRVGVGTNLSMYDSGIHTIIKNPTASGSIWLQPTNRSVSIYDGSNAYLMDVYNGAAVGARIAGGAASYFNGGNVGIGTTAPGTKLHVSSGTIKVDGTGSPAAGKALCFTAAKLLGVCTDTPAADGSCTCN